jgi:3-methylcrotonyl-CoA carboxylase beta subunit
VNRLLDPGPPYLELSPVAGNGMYRASGGGDATAPGAGVITGVGWIAAGECVVPANDAAVNGGTHYPMTAKKHLRAHEIARQNRMPCLYLVDSGGAFLLPQDKVFPDREHFRRIFFNQANDERPWHPAYRGGARFVHGGRGVCPGNGRRGDHRPRPGTIFLSGPPLVNASTGELVTAEEFGGDLLHSRTGGVTDHLDIG